MREWLGKINGILIIIIRKFLALLCQLDRELQLPFNVDRHYCGVIKSTVSHDMVADSDEKYYTEQYWQIIKKYLNPLMISEKITCLDLGCGQGRFVIPLADWCSRYDGTVTGVDVSGSAIEVAKRNVELSGQQNIQFKEENIHEYISTVPDASVDVVFFLEVIFFLPNYEAVLTHIVRVLKSGGLLMASFRSQYFDVLFSLKHGMWDSLDILLKKRAGRLWGKDIYFN